MFLDLKQQKKLRYAILKRVSNGENSLYAKDFGIETDNFVKVIKSLEILGYIQNSDFYLDGEFETTDAVITEQGEQFLKDNSAWGKLVNGFKKIVKLNNSLK
ncbi:YjcQ family protein [Ligilactobacillus sp. WILCCON 0076]|uniref:YjcQ family protein n=1 Tax=Ligilactobacillus ubinensis TaxID=2876789 RepID=A0A9X2FLY8_9LACO|nr:YjcQ family protein [Ligilactobacillus ubinensis]MCP0887795.1 YjcQ family protein [Ligilactobacillus ubinensis]